MNDTVKTKINNIQTIQLEPGATPAKKYPAEISGNSIAILPPQSNTHQLLQTTKLNTPSDEFGRPIYN